MVKDLVLLLLISVGKVKSERTDLPPECVHKSIRITELTQEASYDYRLGTAITSLGDIDGDGVEDYAVGAPGDSHGNSIKNAGAVYIVLRNADGSVKDSKRWVRQDAAKNDFFGSSLTRIGDLDGNGVSELVVGVPGYDKNGYVDSGGMSTLFLNSNGTVIKIVESTRSLRPLRMLNAQDEFGSAVANIGDLDGDGIDDLAVGAKKYDEAGTTDTGCVYICFMGINGEPLLCERITGLTPNSFPKLSSRDFFGASIAAVGDVNSDGTLELAVGSPGYEESGAAYILFLEKQEDGGVFATNFSRISDDIQNEFFVFGDRVGASMASSVDARTGVTRLAIGDDKSQSEYGAVVVFEIDQTLLPNIVEKYPRDGTDWLKEVATVSSEVGGGPQLDKNDHFASSLTFIDDTTTDNMVLMVGVMYDDPAGYASGSIWRLEFDSFDESRCLPQTLVSSGDPRTGSLDTGSSSSNNDRVVLPLVISGLIILICGVTACCYVLFARKHRRDLNCDPSCHGPCPSDKNGVIVGSNQQSMLNSQMGTQSYEGEAASNAMIYFQMPEFDGETDSDISSAHHTSKSKELIALI